MVGVRRSIGLDKGVGLKRISLLRGISILGRGGSLLLVLMDKCVSLLPFV